jgi:uncharacterized membrane protein
MSFLDDYFINPILQNGWFNPVNTVVYSLILIVAVFIVYKILNKMNIKIDKHFFLAVLPFIFWGSSTRVLHDAAFAGILSPELNAFYGAPIFPTPGSYFITFMLAFSVFLISVGIQKLSKVPYWKTMFSAGAALSILNIYFLPVLNFYPLILIAGLTLFWMFLFYIPSRSFQHKFFKKRYPHLKKIFSPVNQLILGAHLLDASATFIALSLYGYLEQHVVPRLIFPLAGPVGMFILKISVVIPVLWIIDVYAEDRNFRNFLKLVVLILGLAPGLRDLIRLMAGV